MASILNLDDPNLLAQLVELSIGYGVGGAASRLADPFVQPLANIAWSNVAIAGQGVPVDVQTLALLARMGITPNPDALDEAANTGFDQNRFTRYVQATRTPPTRAEALDLYNRTSASGDWLRTLLLQGGADERYIDELVLLARQLPSIADLAMARQQEFIDDAVLHERAAQVGFTAEDADLFFKMAGLPPGITVGIELLRRGKIDEARFAEYVAEGHTKTKYTDDLLELRYTPLSAAVAAEALIRERVTQEEAVAIAAENGIDESSFLLWSNMLGRPPGIMEALTLVNRGIVGAPDSPEAQAFFREVVARSDVRTEYADALYNLRIHYPTLYQVRQSLAAGSVTTEVAADTLRKDGYPEEWVQSIVRSAPGSVGAKKKQLSAAIVDTLYEAGLDSHAAAVLALEVLGYSEQDASDYLDLWAARRIVAELVRGVSLIRSRYVGWKIDRPTAVQELQALTADGTAHERLLPDWDVERRVNEPRLTTAEVREAFKYGRFNYDEATAELLLAGWSADDALTLLWIEAHGDPRPATTPPPAPPGG